MQDLIDEVESMNLQQGIGNSFDAKIDNVRAALEAVQGHSREDAVKKLNAFINEVEAQREKKVTADQADQLITAAQDIISLIG